MATLQIMHFKIMHFEIMHFIFPEVSLSFHWNKMTNGGNQTEQRLSNYINTMKAII